jgi:hypothetical protein
MSFTDILITYYGSFCEVKINKKNSEEIEGTLQSSGALLDYINKINQWHDNP